MAVKARKPFAGSADMGAEEFRTLSIMAADPEGFDERFAKVREATAEAKEEQARAKAMKEEAQAAMAQAQEINAANVEAGSKLAAERAAIAEDRAELEKAQAEINDAIIAYKELARIQTEREQAITAARDQALNAVKELLG